MPARMGTRLSQAAKGSRALWERFRKAAGGRLRQRRSRAQGSGLAAPPPSRMHLGDEGRIGLGQQGRPDGMTHGDPPELQAPGRRHGIPVVLEGPQEGHGHHHIAQQAREADPHFRRGAPGQGPVQIRQHGMGVHASSRERGMVMQRGPPRARLSSLASIWTRYFDPSSRSRLASVSTCSAVTTR